MLRETPFVIKLESYKKLIFLVDGQSFMIALLLSSLWNRQNILRYKRSSSLVPVNARAGNTRHGTLTLYL